MANVKPRTSNPISSRDRATGVRRASSVVEGKPRHDFSACIACAACAAACEAFAQAVQAVAANPQNYGG